MKPKYAAVEKSLAKLKQRVGQGGASQRAAEYMAGLFGEPEVGRSTGERHHRRSA